MIYEANVDVVKVKGMMNYLQTEEGETLLRKRFALANTLKSFNALMLLDTDEDHQTKSNSFASLPDLIDRFTQILAAGSDIVATRFLGVSAAGFSTGENDLKNYYDMVKSKQKSQYKQKLTYIDNIMAASLGLSPDTSLKFEFKPLFQMTEGEIADMRLKDAQRDQIYLDSGVLKPSMVAKELKSVDTYSSITTEYLNQLEEDEEDAELSNAFNIVSAGGEEAEGQNSATSNDAKANRSAIQKSLDAINAFFNRKY
jgi:phage-related protein (TIGR01555 family)